MVDERTKIVPGHGPLAVKADLMDFHEMLSTVNETVSGLVKQGKSVGETVAAAPTKKYDSQWGNGFLKPEQFVKLIYQGKTEPVAKQAA